MSAKTPDSIATSYPSAFVKALDTVLADEGGYVSCPEDPGGATRFRISQRQYPDLDMARLTRDAAAAIYYRDWWLRFDFGSLPQSIGAKLFNLAINLGPGPATLCLQRALRACGTIVSEDGVLGAHTREAVASVDCGTLLAALRSEVAGHYRLLAGRRDKQFNRFLKGWLRRAYE